MNILNYKYKAHKLVNIVFYLIIFLIGFLMGLGIKKINIDKILSNILFIEKVEAYSFYTKGDVKLDEEFIYNNFKNSFTDFNINKYSNIACDYVPNYNNEKRLSCYAFSNKQLEACEWEFDDFIGKKAVCSFPTSEADNYYLQYSIDRSKNVEVKKNYNFRVNPNGLDYSMDFTLYSSGMSSKSYGNFYIPTANDVFTTSDAENWKKLNFSDYMCKGSVCYNKPEEFFEEQGYSKKCTSDSLFMSFSDYKKRFLRIYSYGDLTEKMSGDDKRGYKQIQTFPRFALGKFVFKDGKLVRTNDYSTENGKNDVIYYDKQYTVDLIKQYQREEISYEQYRLLIDLYDKVFKNYTHLFLEYSLSSDYDKTNQLLYPYLLLGNKENYPDGYEVCFYYNVKTCNEEGKNCVNKNEDLIFTKIQDDGMGGYEPVEEDECIITQEGCVNNFHGSSSDYSYDDKNILNSLQKFGSTINMFNKYVTDFFFSLNSTIRSLILCIFGIVLMIIIVKLVVK